MIPERLARLREEMAKHNIAIYIVPTVDFHSSEYVGAHFKAREYITGFSGSAGTAVITMEEAGLWTDARYFIQAANQLEGTTVDLYRMGEEGVPSVEEYVKQHIAQGDVIGFDGRVVSGSFGNRLKEISDAKSAAMQTEFDLIDLIWENRPKCSQEPIMLFDESYSGKNTKDKIAEVRKAMKEHFATLHILTSLSDISWLLNIRGGDISYVPVVLSYLVLSMNECIWFVQQEILTDEILAYLYENGITTMPYNNIYSYVQTISADEVVWLDQSIVNYRISNDVSKRVKVVDAPAPSERMRAIKNKIEIEHTKKAHIKDGVAMCKFMYWLKTQVGKTSMTELSVSNYLEELRREQDGFLDLSFETICGYAEHGAIVHYAVIPETDVPIEPKGFLLVDSGGHYMQGTTDVTRTFALGPLTDEMKEHFTRVCRANINLANARFLYGCTGMNLDIVAREPLWEVGLDYKHGTGHGVGHVLSVHEGPNGFRWRQPLNATRADLLEEGMITTDEPGIYIEGNYGIRLENELLCCKGEKNEYGQFMFFENITYVPIDLDAIEPTKMTLEERERLNQYHANVYRVIAPFLTEDEANWLKTYTRAI